MLLFCSTKQEGARCGNARRLRCSDSLYETMQFEPNPRRCLSWAQPPSTIHLVRKRAITAAALTGGTTMPCLCRLFTNIACRIPSANQSDPTFEQLVFPCHQYGNFVMVGTHLELCPGRAPCLTSGDFQSCDFGRSPTKARFRC